MINCDIINLTICLSDLEPDQYFVSTNNKKYLNVTVSARKEPDKYNNDLSVTYKKKKGDETKYVKNSSGKTVSFNNSINNSNNNNSNVENNKQNTVSTNDDLPF